MFDITYKKTHAATIRMRSTADNSSPYGILIYRRLCSDGSYKAHYKKIGSGRGQPKSHTHKERKTKKITHAQNQHSDKFSEPHYRKTKTPTRPSVHGTLGDTLPRDVLKKRRDDRIFQTGVVLSKSKPPEHIKPKPPEYIKPKQSEHIKLKQSYKVDNVSASMPVLNNSAHPASLQKKMASLQKKMAPLQKMKVFEKTPQPHKTVVLEAGNDRRPRKTSAHTKTHTPGVEKRFEKTSEKRSEKSSEKRSLYNVNHSGNRTETSGLDNLKHIRSSKPLNHSRFKSLLRHGKRPSLLKQLRTISGSSRISCFKKVLYNQVIARGYMLYPVFNRRKQKHSYSMVVNNHRVKLGKMFSPMSQGLMSFYTGFALKAAMRTIIGGHKATLKKRSSPYLVSNVERNTALLLTRCQWYFSLRKSRQSMNHRKAIKPHGLFVFGDTNLRYHRKHGMFLHDIAGRSSHGSVLQT